MLGPPLLISFVVITGGEPSSYCSTKEKFGNKEYEPCWDSHSRLIEKPIFVHQPVFDWFFYLIFDDVFDI